MKNKMNSRINYKEILEKNFHPKQTRLDILQNICFIVENRDIPTQTMNHLHMVNKSLK